MKTLLNPKLDLVFKKKLWQGDPDMQAQYTNPTIRQAFHALEQLSADQQTRLRAQVREKALQNALSELAAAREEGLNHGELIGEIRSIPRFLRQPITPREVLARQTDAELQTLLDTLTSQLERQH
jgi:hypothetical protein